MVVRTYEINGDISSVFEAFEGNALFVESDPGVRLLRFTEQRSKQNELWFERRTFTILPVALGFSLSSHREEKKFEASLLHGSFKELHWNIELKGDETTTAVTEEVSGTLAAYLGGTVTTPILLYPELEKFLKLRAETIPEKILSTKELS